MVHLRDPSAAANKAQALEMAPCPEIESTLSTQILVHPQGMYRLLGTKHNVTPLPS